MHPIHVRLGSFLTTLSLLSTLTPPARAADPVRNKTLVVWAAPANLAQRGGSVLTLEKPGGVFDAIVLGELTPAKWMAGSDFWKRTKKEQEDMPVEMTQATDLVQVAIVYEGRQITLYRNGNRIASYTAENQESFGSDSFAVMGLRHLGADAANRFFVGSIDDARIYNLALSSAQIAALKPNQASQPAPMAWWDFENGSAADKIKTFSGSTLAGQARVADGKLHLDQEGAYLVASRDVPSLSHGVSGDPNESARALREKLLRDPHRPGYHFTIPEGQGMPFDPNGAIFWKGRYHLFYIFQDKRGHNWGHVSSTDLFHWRHHPTGLIAGMFSGNCFINKEGRPTMCYHQVGQGNAMAVALDDELNEWKKLDSNPITPKTSPGDPNHDKYRSWDPYGWLEGDTYYAIFGGEHPGIVKAPTLAGNWKYVGDLMGNAVAGVSINEDVSCADFFQLGDRRMLLCISHRLGCRYYLGEWKNEQFHPTFHEKMSWVDNSFFAPESLLDDRGRRIMWAWIFDSPGFKMRTDYGWSGTMSLPRVLSLGNDGALRMNPPEEIKALRYNPKDRGALSVDADSEIRVPEVDGNSLEIDLEIEPTSATQYGLSVACSPGNEEETRIYYDAAEKKLKVDTMKSSLADSPRTVEGGPLELKTGESLRLQVFVDKSVVEVFANGRQAVMRRIYPSRADSAGVKIFARGGPATVTAFKAWEMMPANPF